MAILRQTLEDCKSSGSWNYFVKNCFWKSIFFHFENLMGHTSGACVLSRTQRVVMSYFWILFCSGQKQKTSIKHIRSPVSSCFSCYPPPPFTKFSWSYLYILIQFMVYNVFKCYSRQQNIRCLNKIILNYKTNKYIMTDLIVPHFHKGLDIRGVRFFTVHQNSIGSYITVKYILKKTVSDTDRNIKETHIPD